MVPWSVVMTVSPSLETAFSSSVSRSGIPSAERSIRSFPGLKSVITSSPKFSSKTKVSLPLPPVSVSSPAPPLRISLPLPPSRVSLPVSPVRSSLPLPPSMTWSAAVSTEGVPFVGASSPGSPGAAPTSPVSPPVGATVSVTSSMTGSTTVSATVSRRPPSGASPNTKSPADRSDGSTPDRVMVPWSVVMTVSPSLETAFSSSVSRSGIPSAERSIRSFPGLKSVITSLPKSSPKTKVSLPLPPVSVSSPAPPSRISLPLPPLRMSFPAPPVRMSWPLPPFNT